jgi:2-dehydro-3-deoxy-D-arabinonate dehydratase
MHLVRYHAQGVGVRVGVRCGDRVMPVTGFATVAELMRLPLDGFRATLEAAAAANEGVDLASVSLLAPLDGRGEVWCAGVTYERSRGARMEESSEQSVYDKVYAADRPELFLKSPAWRLVTDGQPVGIRADSGHDVPEPELTVVANAHGEVVGYTVCNDMSSRSIEGENPLYIPQAKVFAGGCALATGIRPAWEVPNPTNLVIRAVVRRNGARVFEGETSTAQLARPIEELLEHLWRANHFPDGVALATGTGIVPDMDFTLLAGDVVEIDIEEVGRLVNAVAVGKEPFHWLEDTAADMTLEVTR